MNTKLYLFFMGDEDDEYQTAEALRWGVSRLATRLRAEQSGGSGEGLTRLAASVLANLRHEGPMTPSELALAEGLQVQSLTRVLNDLEERGRIARSRSEEDRRRQDITLTHEGDEALHTHTRDGNAWLASALRQHLTPVERGLLHLASDLMLRVAERENGRASHRSPLTPKIGSDAW